MDQWKDYHARWRCCVKMLTETFPISRHIKPLECQKTFRIIQYMKSWFAVELLFE